MTNSEVAAALFELADLLEIEGANRFRALAWRRAAAAIEGYPAPVCEMDEVALGRIQGIGKATAAAVLKLCRTGRFLALEELRERIPSGLRLVRRVEGIGPARALRLWREAGIGDLEALRDALESGRLASLAGFGPRVAERVRTWFERGGEGGVIPLARAAELARAAIDALRDRVEAAMAAGGIRRYCEVVDEVVVVVATTTPAPSVPGVRVHAVPPEAWGPALQQLTGSEAHNVRLRELARARSLELRADGLRRTGKLVACLAEEDLYRTLGLEWIPPPLREDRGEIEGAAAGTLPRLVEVADVRGDLHSHTTYSDGRPSVAEMAKAARQRGYEYFAVTDHGPRLSFMRTLTLEAAARQRAEVDAAGDGLCLLQGIELNIAPDGSLDYEETVLRRFDLCVASVHSSFGLSKTEQTKRLLKAVGHPCVHVLGHPSGRRMDRREGIDFDVEAVAAAAARHGVALEINAHPWRLDLREEHVRIARRKGVRFAISTDAHSPKELDNMHFGVGTAQRAWVEPDEVINTWPLERLLAFLRKER